MTRLVLRESHLSPSATGNIGPIAEPDRLNLHKMADGLQTGPKNIQATSNDAFKVCAGEHVQISRNRRMFCASAVFT